MTDPLTIQHTATPAYLSTAAAAQHLGLSASYLKSLRSRGKGPTYSKVGRRCLYRVAALDLWMGERARANVQHAVVDAIEQAERD